MINIDFTTNNKASAPLSLEEIFSTIEKISGLEVSIYSPLQGAYSLQKLPVIYQRHMSDFCRIIKANKTGAGCAGHDAIKVTQKAGEKSEPFVNGAEARRALQLILAVYESSKINQPVYLNK